MKYLKKHILTLLGLIIGAAGGYLYYYYVGCAEGSCSITSKPLNSTLYGAMMGGLFFNLFRKETGKEQQR